MTELFNPDYDAAVTKLDEELKSVKGDKYVTAVKSETCEALKSFCRQSAKFSEAVCSGGTLSSCLASIFSGKSISAMSDLDVYSAAVKFYMPAAKVEFQMSINTGEDAGGGDVIDLMSLL